MGDIIKELFGNDGRLPKEKKLTLTFPSYIETPQDKVAYALWSNGAQSISNLILLTDLSPEEITSAINHLLEKQDIVQIESLSDTLGIEELRTYDINEKLHPNQFLSTMVRY